MANVLVTGGFGFIGSHLVKALITRKHTVRVLDDLSTGRRENLESVAGRFDFMQGDLRDTKTCAQACADIHYIYHEAAIPSVPRSVEDPQTSHDVNVNGTFNLLMAAKNNGVKRVIYAASSSAYGDSEISPKHEGIIPAPLSPYAVQKLLGEHYLSSFYECFGLETISLRYFNVFGPQQDPSSDYAAAIPAFVAAIISGQPPTVYGNGEQTRDFTYIDNVVHGNMLAMDVNQTHGEAVNVACGGQISVNRVIEAINTSLGTDIQPQYVHARAGDVMHSCADIGLAKKVLNYESIVNLEDGLARTIEYYKAVLV